MKWRPNHTYNASYVVHRIVTELGVDEDTVWETVDEEFGTLPTGTMSSEDAAYLSDVIAAGASSPAVAGKPVQGLQPELLSSKEVAAMLKMSVNKLNGERAAGNIAYLQFGGRIWFTRDAIEDYRRKCTHRAVPQRCLRETYRKRRAV